MAKADLSVRLVSKSDCASLLAEHHYLSKIQRGFKSGYNFGLFEHDVMVGACIFTGVPVRELLQGCFGLPATSSQEGLFELSRLVLQPDFQSREHNAASWFVSKAIHMLRKQTKVKAILSYADQGYHSGTVYAACNFKYYGLTDKKCDFWFKIDGVFVKHSRGTVKGADGEWRPRNQKHRFLMIFDKELQCRWQRKKWPSQENFITHQPPIGV